MKTRHTYSLIITAIIIIIALPPTLCYLFIVKPTSHTTATQQSPQPGDSSDTADTTPPSQGYTILIDPGHGGFDPGKVSPSGIREKDINLQISLKLKSCLENYGFKVYLTRDRDCSLDSNHSGSHKMSDLRARTSKASELNSDLYISIHQNSYSAESVHGAQVFYYSTSKSGKSLAESIQNRIISEVDPDNTREPKGNSDYMVLVESPCTAVIVECGFLSNAAECENLCNPRYQVRLASAIAAAVSSWRDSDTSNPH